MGYSRDQIISDLKGLLLELKKDHDIREAYLFGSYARGNPGEHSDIDVAVVLGAFRDGSPLDERFEIFHWVQGRNSFIEVVCLTEDEFRAGEITLVRHIKREGIRII
jgi:predicted nucleotidyltransferase